ncbi:unnamed protein product [Prorocentrum cordatum]|uniref:Anaphase-promoting complex subunit 5 n=1 Tax=Prorocentrum cordatum TaxID=2364126 RepID=A0ABN9W2G1_9DINO|nr:unnamed protein product [Polarella glacialis]
MRELKLEPNVISYSAGAHACEMGGRWQQALRMLRNMCLITLNANFDACGVIASMCEQGGQWEQVMWLLREMCDVCTVARCSARYSYQRWDQHLREGQWQRTLALQSEIREAKVAPNAVASSSWVSACEKGGQWQGALWQLDEIQEGQADLDAAGYSPTIAPLLRRGDSTGWSASALGTARQRVRE